MDATSARWRPNATSEYEWEQSALEQLRAILPDEDPYYAWTNFQFTDGGALREVDALVVTPKGVFLTEIKSWAGRITGDQGTWTQIRPNESRVSHSNALAITANKARSLKGLLQRNWKAAAGGPRLPYIEPLVWFSNPAVTIALPAELHGKLAIADDNTNTRGIATLSQALLEITASESRQANFERITSAQATELATAMTRIGFRGRSRTRSVGSYTLDLPAFAERGSTQDFTARHHQHGTRARVRVYSNVFGATASEALELKDAATREFLATHHSRIEGVVRAVDSADTEFGPAVIFEHDTREVRLDRFLAERREQLSPDDCFRILESIATTVRELHRQRISHRMLTPESVWLRPRRQADGTERWDPLVTDFSLASSERSALTATIATVTRHVALPALRTGAVEVVLGDPSIETFLAPETFTNQNTDGVACDVYSLGCLAYLLVTGRPPAADRAQLKAALASGGLSAAAVLDDVDPAIEAFIRSCTDSIASNRNHSLSNIVDQIAQIRASLAGAPPEQSDPLTAEEGDTLDDRFTVRRRLGKGSTAVALWCHDAFLERDVVVKVALGGDSDDRVNAEAEALRELKHENIVELLAAPTLASRPSLVLSFAGEQSLAGYLRTEGSVSVEYLRRWGHDLLKAVAYLEDKGVAHRDIKPDNLGVVQVGRSRELHLVLYDFSLAGISSTEISAGTPSYLDPFLQDSGRGAFDLAAERYAAAVTLHEMATGELPTWGDGNSDPSYLPPDVTPTIHVASIDPEIRAPMAEFFARALQRDITQRFDTTDDMARAWIDVFAGWEASDDADLDDADDIPGASGATSSPSALLPDTLTLADPITSLNTSRKLKTALRKLGADTVRDIASLDAMAVNQARGVAVKTRKSILRLRTAILERFASELSAAAATTAVPAVDATGSSGRAYRPDLDQLGLALVPPRGQRGRIGQVASTVRTHLGLEGPSLADDWATTAAVAAASGVTTAAVSQTLQKARAHWGTSSDLRDLAFDLVAALVDLGGIAGVSELTSLVADDRGAGADASNDARLAHAAVRAAIEAATPIAGWFTLRRTGRRTLVALDGAEITKSVESDDGNALVPAWFDPAALHTAGACDAAALIDLGVALGSRADALVESSTLVPSVEVVPALRSIRQPTNAALSDARLVRLAAAASAAAVANAASDLMPVAIEPRDALRWARPVLVGLPRMSHNELVARVSARFPTAVLPPRPELDGLLVSAGLAFTWSDHEQLYVAPAAQPGGVGPLTVAESRQRTVVSIGGSTVTPADPAAPEILEAQAIDERLQRSLAAGGFLALRVPTNRLVDAQRGLARFEAGQHPMTRMDLEALFLRHLRDTAREESITWDKFEGADVVDGPRWNTLSIYSQKAVDATLADVVQHERVMAWYPGAIVRHGKAPLDVLRDATLDVAAPLTTLWLVVLGPTAQALPTVDGSPVPTLANSQWLDLSDAWLKNDHRAGGIPA